MVKSVMYLKDNFKQSILEGMLLELLPKLLKMLYRLGELDLIFWIIRSIDPEDWISTSTLLLWEWLYLILRIQMKSTCCVTLLYEVNINTLSEFYSTHLIHWSCHLFVLYSVSFFLESFQMLSPLHYDLSEVVNIHAPSYKGVDNIILYTQRRDDRFQSWVWQYGCYCFLGAARKQYIPSTYLSLGNIC